MVYSSPFDDTDEPETGRICDHPDCCESGEYRAPRSAQKLRDYYHFCLDHVRAYNKEWNYFKDFTPDQMYAQMQADVAWERETWSPAASIHMEARLHDFVRRFNREQEGPQAKHNPHASKEAQALETLGLGADADQKTVKSRYRELVKRYHPDTNPDNPKAVERFKMISEAYMLIRKSWQTKEA